MSKLPLALLCLLLLAPAGSVARAQTRPTPDAEELIRRERIRAAVEQALEDQLRDEEDGGAYLEEFIDAALRMVAIGPETVPFLSNELEQDSQYTFFFCTYALGLIGSPEAEAALRRAVERADRGIGDFAVVRKAWSAYGLGLMGKADAVDLLFEGTHVAVAHAIHADTSVLEAIGLLTAPESVPLLLAQIDRYADDSERRSDRKSTVKALRRIADRRAVPKLVELLDDSSAILRREAARGLETMGTPAAVDALVRVLAEGDSRVRKFAALALERIRPADRLDAIAARLNVEENSVTRGSLYALVAALGGPRATEILIPYWGREDSTDRMFLVTALGRTLNPAALPVLRAALGDADRRVAARAVETLVALDSDDSVQPLLEGLRSIDPSTVELCVRALIRLKRHEAAPLLAERLLKVELQVAVTSGSERSRVELLGDALVALHYSGRLDELREAQERQRDATLQIYIGDLLRRLALQKTNGKRVARWIETLASTERDERLMAYDRLGALGGAKAVRGLAERFARVSPDEGELILRTLGRIDQADSRALIRRVLLGPEFDGYEQRGLRDSAAWAARQLGGDDMFEAIAACVTRRDARDARPLVYLALTDPLRALPILEQHRIPRMRYLSWGRGKEQEQLDRIAEDIRAGRSLDWIDLPPDGLGFP